MNNAPARRAELALAASFLSALMFGLEISSVPVVLPLVGDLLNAEFTDLQWIMNAYTIAGVVVLVAAGVLADRYGRRRVFLTAVTVFGIASALCGLAPQVPVLIGGRSLQGVAGGAMMICGLAILSQQFREGRPRARAFGIWGIGLGFGLGFGPIIGAGLVAVAGWRWVFLVHVLLAALTLVLIAFGVRESREAARGYLDIPGMVTLSVALFALVFYITQGPTVGFASPLGIAVLCCAAAGFIAFILIELHVDRPMVPLTLFGIRPFRGALLGAVGMNFSFWPLIVYLPIYLERGLGYDVATASAVLLAYTLPTFVLPPSAERLALRFGARTMIPIGSAVIGAGLFLLYLGSAVSQPSWMTILPGALVAGAGLGLTNTPVTNTTTASVPESRAGTASGIDMTARLTFLAINIAIMGSVLMTGITAGLRANLPGLSEDRLRDLATQVANNEDPAPLMDTAGELPVGEPSHSWMTSAVTQGFGLATLYGAIAVAALAVASWAAFAESFSAGRRRPRLNLLRRQSVREQSRID
ncbi:MFS transporter [Nocardia noduli]|uniref:MFS transporter n=1 Tax=Nocardia noduli TaxID=2815722 RepID=UPI001C22001D|nr:MFS transporter [Nocardia noduli]